MPLQALLSSRCIAASRSNLSPKVCGIALITAVGLNSRCKRNQIPKPNDNGPLHRKVKAEAGTSNLGSLCEDSLECADPMPGIGRRYGITKTLNPKPLAETRKLPTMAHCLFSNAKGTVCLLPVSTDCFQTFYVKGL